jgi:hypothetical protein
LVQTVDAYEPPLLELAEQSSRTAEGIGVAGHPLGAAVLTFRDQPRTFQNGHVFLNGGK